MFVKAIPAKTFRLLLRACQQLLSLRNLLFRHLRFLFNHTMAQIQSSASPTPPNQSSFPQDPADFDADSRISFDKLNQKFILETEDDKGNPLEFEYDDGLKRWIPVVRPLPFNESLQRTSRDEGGSTAFSCAMTRNLHRLHGKVPAPL